MKFKPVKLAPALIAVCVIIFVCLLRVLHLDLFERPELMTYDMRVRTALTFSKPAATNLGFVYIDDASITFLKTNESLGYRYGLLWPRQVYGRLIKELSTQHAKAVAFDIIFPDLRDDHPPVHMEDDSLIDSDLFFALEMQRAKNVILADTRDAAPPALFATNALALGDITSDTNKDSDGILRRAQAFRTRRKWHPLFQQVQADPGYGVDLNKARIEPGQIVLPRSNGEVIKIPLDRSGSFELADFVGDKLPPGMSAKAKPFTDERIWHMGIVLAAQELKLDLNKAVVDPSRGNITLYGAGGISRTIPVDSNGYFYIDWALRPEDPRLYKEPIQNLLLQDRWRLDQSNNIPNHWAGKLAVVGSSATGNNLTDRGATPLDRDTLLVSEHWNVANSILTGQFIRRSSLVIDLLAIVLMGVLAGILTWQLRALIAFLVVMGLAVGYFGVGMYLFVGHRYWLPLVLPILGALLMTHICLVTWRVVFEQAERRRVKSIFSRIVSPNIVNELLEAETFSLGGARREVTVLFADVRGFTEFTDVTQEKAAEYVACQKLSGAEVEAYYDEQARETLLTVNTYLALVADTVKKHDGTLDKYIGDCVMAFWGAPTPNTKHACCCVRAAIDAQRALHEFNCQRTEENKRRGVENATRTAAGLSPKPLLPILMLGSGINTGPVTVGLMGSEAHILNYTVFGHEVNLASRLESLSGRGRILISETTYKHLLRDDPALAASCISLPAANVKGIRSAVNIYEVPWQSPGTPAGTPSEPTLSGGKPAAPASS